MAAKTGGTSAGARLRARGEPARLRERVRADLERVGVDAAFCESILGTIEAVHEQLGPAHYEAILAGVATAYGVHRQGEENLRQRVRELGEVQRLMDAAAGEIKKLDEALRTLTTYVGKMRKPAARKSKRVVH